MFKSKENLMRYPDETWDPMTYLDEDKRKELFSTIQKDEQNVGACDDDYDIDNIFIKTGCVSEAKGSCYIQIGHTKVICTLYGPREITRKDDFNYKLAKLNCQFRYTTFSTLNFQRRTGTLTSAQSLFQQQQKSFQQHDLIKNEDILRSIEEALKPSVMLHKYPKSQIDLYIVCIQSDLRAINYNRVLSASIIASSMTLIDANIECYDLVSSYTNNKINLTLSYMPSLHQVTSIYYTGDPEKKAISIDLYKSYIKDSIDYCKKVYVLMKCVLVGKLKPNFDDIDQDDGVFKSANGKQIDVDSD